MNNPILFRAKISLANRLSMDILCTIGANYKGPFHHCSRMILKPYSWRTSVMACGALQISNRLIIQYGSSELPEFRETGVLDLLLTTALLSQGGDPIIFWGSKMNVRNVARFGTNSNTTPLQLLKKTQLLPDSWCSPNEVCCCEADWCAIVPFLDRRIQ